jgi:hypothetical protein
LAGALRVDQWRSSFASQDIHNRARVPDNTFFNGIPLPPHRRGRIAIGCTPVGDAG